MNTAACLRLIASIGLLACIHGCGKSEPSKSSDKQGEEKSKSAAPSTPAPQPGGSPSTPATSGPISPTDPRQVAAEAFIRDLRTAANPGPVPPPVIDKISPNFLKIIGKPTLTPAEKTAGYSAEAASDWLGKAGRALASVGLPTGSAADGVALFTGTFTNDNTPDGRILLRLVQTDGNWKVDWFELGTATEASPPKATSTEESLQGFASQALLDAITAEGVLPANDRVPLVAAVLSPKLKQSLAEPFSQDRERGYDYNPARIAQVAGEWGHSATAYSRTRTAPGQYRVEITKGGKPQVYSMKLVKGQAEGEWLVDEFKPQ